MSTRAFILAGTLLGFLLCSGPLIAYDREGTCREQRKEWLDALELFKQALEDHSGLKDEDIGPRIQEVLRQKGGRVPMARVVQEVLQERTRTLAEAQKRIETVASEERSAFEGCKRCFSAGRGGRNAFSKSDPEVVLRERLMAQMRDQTINEAYAQYKDSRLPLPYSSAEGPGFASQAWYWEREAAGPSRGRGPYPYGYPNPRQPNPYYPGWR